MRFDDAHPLTRPVRTSNRLPDQLFPALHSLLFVGCPTHVTVETTKGLEEVSRLARQILVGGIRVPPVVHSLPAKRQREETPATRVERLGGLADASEVDGSVMPSTRRAAPALARVRHALTLRRVVFPPRVNPPVSGALVVAVPHVFRRALGQLRTLTLSGRPTSGAGCAFPPKRARGNSARRLDGGGSPKGSTPQPLASKNACAKPGGVMALQAAWLQVRPVLAQGCPPPCCGST